MTTRSLLINSFCIEIALHSRFGLFKVDFCPDAWASVAHV